MTLKDIFAVSGMPGLFKFIAQTKTGAILESLNDKKRIPTYATQKLIALKEIAVYTTDKELPLIQVFKRIFDKEKGNTPVDAKSDDTKLKEYFATIVPEYDKEKVYSSDIKKMILWYNTLQTLGMIDDKIEEEKTEEESKEEKQPEQKAEEKPTEAPIDEVKKTEVKKQPSEEKPKKKTTKEKTSAEKTPKKTKEKEKSK
ncbi:MAG: DUF5606 domain-containing protein [Bacteroidales bacterium]|nr:DUF5606 domain-containing protein [Bacteroidales bacterium]